MVSIAELPDELFEAIVSFVDPPKDLLQLALTHSRAQRITIPLISIIGFYATILIRILVQP